jgi:hypothetical protein
MDPVENAPTSSPSSPAMRATKTKAGIAMTAKEMVLQDLPDLYPGLTRSGIEQVLRTLDNPPSGGGPSLGSELIAIAPIIAERLKSLSGKELTDYLSMMKSTAVLVLQMWTSNDKAPPPAAIATSVEALSDTR